MIPGPSKSERSIDEYSAALERFSRDEQVAQALINVRRNSLFRARAFDLRTIDAILESIRRIASSHRESSDVRTRAIESAFVATDAITSDRLMEATALYSGILDARRAGEGTDAESQKRLLSSMTSLINSFSVKHPAAVFALWSDTVSTFPDGQPPAELTGPWIDAACSLARALMPVDIIAGYTLWIRALEWSRAGGIPPEVGLELLKAAYVLIRRKEDDGLTLNATLWNFVIEAEAFRGDSEIGRTGRMVSLEAALDMATSIYQSRHSIMVGISREMRKELGADADESTLKSVFQQPRWAAAIDEFDHPIADVLSYAERWLEESLVWHPAWAEFIRDLHRSTNSVTLFSPSFDAFRKRVLLLAERTFREGLATAHEHLLFTEEKAEWLGHPLVPFSWTEVPEESLMREVLAPMATRGGVLEGNTYRIERVRVHRPAFYPLGVLVETQVVDANGVRGIMFCLSLPAQVAVFRGVSDVIQNLNGMGLLAGMDNPTVVFDYLLFFCYAVWGEEGPFRIIRSMDEFDLIEPLTPEVEQEIRKILIPDPRPSTDVNEAWRLQTAVQYSDQLFRVVFELKPNGKVEMLADTPLKVPPLRVRRWKMAGPMRVLAD